MPLTEPHAAAEATLLAVHPAAVGFASNAASADTLAIYDSLVERGRASMLTSDECEELGEGARTYRLSMSAVESHRQLNQRRTDEADQN